jgi:hypothetical protein
MLQHHLVDSETQQEILRRYDVITKQNYFSHNKYIIMLQDGLAMGAPSSGLIAEIFLQHLEHLHLAHLTHKHHIINYCRYVDDIFLIFHSIRTGIQSILTDFNALHPELHVTAETEKDNALNYPDTAIQRTPTNMYIYIYIGYPPLPTTSYLTPPTTTHTTNMLQLYANICKMCSHPDHLSRAIT